MRTLYGILRVKVPSSALGVAAPYDSKAATTAQCHFRVIALCPSPGFQCFQWERTFEHQSERNENKCEKDKKRVPVRVMYF